MVDGENSSPLELPPVTNDGGSKGTETVRGGDLSGGAGGEGRWGRGQSFSLLFYTYNVTR